MSQPVVIGAVPWEQLIAQAAEPAPVRPPGAFTFAEWKEKTGKGRYTAVRMLRRLIDSGKVRMVEGAVKERGRTQRTVFYVPCAPRNSQRAT